MISPAGHLHRAACRVLAIKAETPPEYIAISESLSGRLFADYSEAATPVILAAAEKIARYPDRAEAIVADLAAQLRRMGEALPAATSAELAEGLLAAYSLGADEIGTQLGVSYLFDLADQDAIAGLQRAGLFWIGDAYGTAVEGPILTETRKVLDLGLGRVEAGARLEAAFAGRIARSESYWQGLASTTATRARSFGALESLHRGEVVEYEYLNPMDERTSAVCRALDGKVFTVAGGLELRDRLLLAETPDDWREIAPWPDEADLYDDAGEMLDTATLQRMGIATPPLHFHCRSQIIARFA